MICAAVSFKCGVWQTCGLPRRDMVAISYGIGEISGDFVREVPCSDGKAARPFSPFTERSPFGHPSRWCALEAAPAARLRLLRSSKQRERERERERESV